MPERLTDSIIKALPVPQKGNRITYDADVKGFGVRVTASGARAFVLNYRTGAGRERRFTIGSFPDWRTAAARQEAAELKKRVDRGEDPLGEFQDARDAKTMADLCQRFRTEHLPKKRPSTQRDYAGIIDAHILPALKQRKVAEITFADVDDLHRHISKHAPYRANRTVAVLGKMFSLAIKWGWRTDSPAKGVERNHEAKRQTYLSPPELIRLADMLTIHPDRDAANAIRLLLLTGARRGEVLSMRWADLNLVEGIWTKPGAATKQKTEHRVPLSAAVRLLLTDLRTQAAADAVFVFPGRGAQGFRRELKKDWATICKAAGIDGVRVHDLRHTYASVLASSGQSLPVIGALLGRTQPATTARYAHLFDDPLRAATERAAAALSGSATADVVPFKRNPIIQ